MDRTTLLLQRLIDGEASASELSLAQQLAASEPRHRSMLDALQSLHRTFLKPSNVHADHHQEHQVLLTRIITRLPTRPPVVHARVTPVELVYAVMIIVLVGFGFGLVGNLFSNPLLHLVVAIGSLIAGIGLFALAGFIRRMEAGLLGHFLHRPIAVGPADLLVYRAIGVGLVIGGVWLSRLAG